MKKSIEKPDIHALDKALAIQASPQFPPVCAYDELLAFAPVNNWVWALLIPGGLSLLLYGLDSGLLLLLLFNTLLALIGFLWNYRYNLRKRPVIKVNRQGITYKRSYYSWDKIGNMVCAEGYDAERSTYDSTYIRFRYNNSIKTLVIDGLSRPVAEILHYIHAFRANRL